MGGDRSRIQAAIAALPGTGVDTGKAEFTVPEMQPGAPGLDFSVKEDGTLAFYAPRSTKEWQEVPSLQYLLGDFGHVTVYQLTDGKIERTLELRESGALANVTEYDKDGRVSASFEYDFGGTKIISRSVYTYSSTDQEDEDFRLLKLVETYNVADLNTRDLSKLASGSGTLQSRTHYLARHAEAPAGAAKGEASLLSETTLGRFDYLGLGLVDYTESYLKPRVAGGDPIFDSIVQQQYSLFQLVQSVTYKNPAGTTVCGDGFSGCEAVWLDVFTYYPGTDDIDLTTRYSIAGNDLSNRALQSVFRTEQVSDEVSVTHDFGDDFAEDTSDDEFTVSRSLEIGNDLDGDTGTANWGSEVFTYTGIKDTGLTRQDGYKIAFEQNAFTGLKSHAVQYDVYGDGTLIRSKNFEFSQGFETKLP